MTFATLPVLVARRLVHPRPALKARVQTGLALHFNIAFGRLWSAAAPSAWAEGEYIAEGGGLRHGLMRLLPC